MAKRKLSHDAIRDAIRAALAPPGTDKYNVWLVEVFDSKVVYSKDEKYFEAEYSIDSDGKATVGTATEVAKVTTYEPVSFAAEFSGGEDTGTGYVKRYGKLFEAGDYPDKNFSVTEVDLDAAVADFVPVDNDLEHKATVLSEKKALGKLVSIERKGSALYGSVEVPKWLDSLFPNEPIKTSLSWSRASKRINGNALVITPRISDAELVAAFAAEQRSTTGDDSRIERGKPMKVFDLLKAILGKAEADPAFAASLDEAVPTQAPVVSPVTPANPATPDTSAAFAAEQAKTAALEAEVARLKADNAAAAALRVDATAAQFADNAVKAKKAMPGERDTLVALFKQAILDDAGQGGAVTFSDDGQLVPGDRCKQLATLIEQRPAHDLDAEKLAGRDNPGLRVVFSSNDADAVTPERKAQLLAMTETGRAAAAQGGK